MQLKLRYGRRRRATRVDDHGNPKIAITTRIFNGFAAFKVVIASLTTKESTCTIFSDRTPIFMKLEAMGPKMKKS